eukprot:PhF_6_TR16998/c0_g1_i2/m.25725
MKSCSTLTQAARQSKSIVRLQEELDAASRENRRLDKTLQHEVKVRGKQAVHLLKSIESIKTENKKLIEDNAKCDELKLKIDATVQEKAATLETKYMERITSAEASLKQATASHESLRKQFDEVTERCKSQQQKIQTLEAQLADLSSSKTTQQVESISLKQSLQAVQDEFNEFKQQATQDKSTAKKTIASLESEIAVFKQKCSDFEKALEDSSSKLKIAEDKLANAATSATTTTSPPVPHLRLNSLPPAASVPPLPPPTTPSHPENQLDGDMVDRGNLLLGSEHSLTIECPPHFAMHSADTSQSATTVLNFEDAGTFQLTEYRKKRGTEVTRCVLSGTYMFHYEDGVIEVHCKSREDFVLNVQPSESGKGSKICWKSEERPSEINGHISFNISDEDLDAGVVKDLKYGSHSMAPVSTSHKARLESSYLHT